MSAWPAPPSPQALQAALDAELATYPGRIVSEPPRHRECPLPQSNYACPQGTVWQCNCGKTWVSEGPPYRHAPGLTTFRRERRLERRRRLRRGNPA